MAIFLRAGKRNASACIVKAHVSQWAGSHYNPGAALRSTELPVMQCSIKLQCPHLKMQGTVGQNGT